MNWQRACPAIGMVVTFAVGNAAGGPSTLKETPLQLKTSDGVELAASYYAPPAPEKAGTPSPAAVLIHMYPAERRSWAPILGYLHYAGFAVLSYDIRGTGGSAGAGDLALKYQTRDSGLFQSAWHDAEAAVKWLAARPEVDGKRVVLIGASIGSSIAIEYAAQNAEVKAIVCLSPGTGYMNVDTKAHIARCGERPILLAAPAAEREDPEALAKLYPKAMVDLRPGGRDQHGTNMFATDYGESLVQRIIEFIAAPVGLPPAETWSSVSTKVQAELKWRRTVEPVMIEVSATGPYGYSIRRFQSDTGALPTSLKDLFERPADPVLAAKWNGPYLNGGLRRDIWGNDLRYSFGEKAIHNKGGFDLWSAGPDGKDGTEDDIGNWEVP